MLTKRIIPCLDVRDGKVVKGVKFQDHQIMGGIIELAQRYSDADELVFYDISASAEGRRVDRNWVRDTAKVLDIPFCVAGGISSIADAEEILSAGADKVSINSPALKNPQLITDLAQAFGSQCIVVGIDSFACNEGYEVWRLTGKASTAQTSGRRTLDWVQEVQDRGAGEIVLNCMNQDGTRVGYDIRQTAAVRDVCHVPLIASGGAGGAADFAEVFEKAGVYGALAAGIFHRQECTIKEVKQICQQKGMEMRL